jgi:hypothetical protein
MESKRKKEIAREYRERKRSEGIFAVRCTATGETWVASSRHLDTQQNGIWFTLRQGGHLNKAIQTAWNTHGETSFAYEVLEEVTDDNPLLIASLLKERERLWREQLGAASVVS